MKESRNARPRGVATKRDRYCERTNDIIGGLRLQDVADDVGISHPAVLHHFGSREALVQAVVSRAIDKLQTDLFRGIASAPDDGAGLFDRVFETLATRGQARLIGWLLLSG